MNITQFLYGIFMTEQGLKVTHRPRMSSQAYVQRFHWYTFWKSGTNHPHNRQATRPERYDKIWAGGVKTVNWSISWLLFTTPKPEVGGGSRSHQALWMILMRTGQRNKPVCLSLAALLQWETSAHCLIDKLAPRPCSTGSCGRTHLLTWTNP